jgi:hypothetical protein
MLRLKTLWGKVERRMVSQGWSRTACSSSSYRRARMEVEP